MKLKEMGEFAFIESITKETIVDRETLKVGIGDDCAVYVASAGQDQLITTDSMVEGIHFSFELMRPFDIGFRLAAASISDIAAMGGIPRQAILSIAVNKEYDTKDLQGIVDGVKAQCKAFNVNLVGGDMVGNTGVLVITMTVVGEVEAGKAVLRSGAKSGDWVGVTNVLGSSATGLDVLTAEQKEYYASKDAYQRPVPQVALGQHLRLHGATAMNDISDGLASELNEIAKASHVHISVDKQAIPLHKETLAWSELRAIDPVEFALYGGEDFQLVFTVPDMMKEMLEKHPLLTFIGRVEDKPEGVTLVNEELGEEIALDAKGYSHFTE